MKLGRWIVLAVVTFFASCSIGAYQSYQARQPNPHGILIAQASHPLSPNADSSDVMASPLNPQNDIDAVSPRNEGNPSINAARRVVARFFSSNDDRHRTANAHVPLPATPTDRSRTWLLEFPQHWVQDGDCQVRGTLKTLLVQKGNTLAGRLHWVWNGQNDAAIFTGTVSDRTVQLYMSPPEVGGFAILFKGTQTGTGTVEGNAMAQSVCHGKDGSFVLTPLDRPQPSPLATVLPLFEKPFDDEYLMSNYFDHDQPRQFVDDNGYLTNWKGDRLPLGNPGAGIDGHGGYDWGLPENTPLKAMADGIVTFSGEGSSFFCPPLQQNTTGNYIYILHTAPNGEQFEAEYVHLNRVDVKEGDRVTSGQIIGLSGNTGCSTGPHLHLGVRKVTQAEHEDRWLVDPYGWDAPHSDPWKHNNSGTESVWLWKAEEAPILYEYGR